MKTEEKNLNSNYELLNSIPKQTESKKNVINNLNNNTISIEEKEELEDDNSEVKLEHIPRNGVKSVTQKINTKEAKKLFMLKRQTTINCKISSLEKLEKIYNMTENDLDLNNLLIRKNKPSFCTYDLNFKLDSDNKIEKDDSEVSEDEFSESKAKEILLQNRSIKVKEKTIKKMNIVFKRTANLIKKKVSHY
jgi:hypothetical protein